MRIALVVGDWPCWSEQFIARDAAALAARGHDVLVWPANTPLRGARWHRVAPAPDAPFPVLPPDPERPWPGITEGPLPTFADPSAPTASLPATAPASSPESNGHPPLSENIRLAAKGGERRPGGAPGVRAGALMAAVASCGWTQARRIPAVLRAAHGLPWRPDVTLAHFAGWPAVVGRGLSAGVGGGFAVFAHARDVWTPWPPGWRAAIAADAVLTCSRAARDAIASGWPGVASRLFLCRHGVPLPPWTGASVPPAMPTEGTLPAGDNAVTPASPENDASPPLVLAAGRLVEKKGFPDALDAFARLRDAGVAFRAEVVGDGPLRGVLAARIATCRLGDRVRLRPALPSEAFAALLGRATVFVHPGVVASDGDRDGVPNAVLEAMALGTTVVSGTAGGVVEAVTDEASMEPEDGGPTGWRAASGDAESLASVLGQALGDAEARRCRAANARRRVERMFSWRVTTEGLERALADAAEAGRKREG